MFRSPLKLSSLSQSRILSRALSPGSFEVKHPIHTVAVIGGGVMGSGIAQVAATAGNRVFVYDLTDPFLEATRYSIGKSLERIGNEKFKGDNAKAEEFVKKTKANLNYTTDLKAAFDNTELVVEAIYENLEAKRKLFAKLENQKIADKKCIFSSNSLSLTITDIAFQSRKKDRFIGTRFFFPVPRTKVCEITRTKDTSEETIAKVTEWVTKLEKFPVLLVDTPGGGGIVHRLPQFNKALGILARGDATREQIDLAMKHSSGFYKGPLQIMDCIGLDVILKTVETLAERYPNEPMYTVSPLLKKMVQEGKHGVKSGEGFYKYKDNCCATPQICSPLNM